MSDFDLTDMLANWRKLLLGATLGLLSGVGWAFWGPKWYSSQLSVVPSVVPKSGGGSLMGAAAAMGMMADLPIDIGGSSDVERVSAILHSNSVTDAVIAKFNLKARYRERYLEDARSALWKHCSTKIDKKPNLVTLECEDKSAEIARQILVYFAECANLVTRRVATSSAREERKFLETRVGQARLDLDKASRSLREFQEKNKVISLPEQAKAIVNSMATLRAEMFEKQLQLSFVDSFSSSEESTSEQLRRQVGLLQGKLRALEESRSAPDPSPTDAKQVRGAASSGGGLFPPAMNVPRLQYEIEQLYREQKIQEALLMLLTQRYETARVNEARDTSSIQVLDAPVSATKQSRPKRLVSVAGGGSLGLMLAAAWIVGMKKRKGGQVQPSNGV